MNEKVVKIRRVIGITALLLWVVAIVPQIVLSHSCKLIWHLDNWAFFIAPVFTIAYAVMLTIQVGKGKHLAIKLLEWFCCGIVTLLCIIVFLFAGPFVSYKIWSNKNYVVYDEYGDFAAPSIYTLYKRSGLIDEHPCFIRLGVWREGGNNFKIENADYSIYETINLIKEEADVKMIENDSLFHVTTFYRLSNGNKYGQAQNDSLWMLINNSIEN